MTHLPMSVTADADLSVAASVLVDTAIKSLPVVDGDLVIGMVSRRDVIAVLAKRDPLIAAEVDELLRSADVESTSWSSTVWCILDGPTESHAREIARVLAATVPGVVGVSFRS